MTDTNLTAATDFETRGELQAIAPTEVRWALKLLWLSLAFSVVQYFIFLRVGISVLPVDGPGRGPAIIGLGMPVMGFIFGGYLNIQIAHKKNWARIVKLILAAISLAFQLAFSPRPAGLEYLNAFIVPALNVAALYLLFLTAGRLWFRHMPSRTQP